MDFETFFDNIPSMAQIAMLLFVPNEIFANRKATAIVTKKHHLIISNAISESYTRKCSLEKGLYISYYNMIIAEKYIPFLPSIHFLISSFDVTYRINKNLRIYNTLMKTENVLELCKFYTSHDVHTSIMQYSVFFYIRLIEISPFIDTIFMLEDAIYSHLKEKNMNIMDSVFFFHCTREALFIVLKTIRHKLRNVVISLYRPNSVYFHDIGEYKKMWNGKLQSFETFQKFKNAINM